MQNNKYGIFINKIVTINRNFLILIFILQQIFFYLSYDTLF